MHKQISTLALSFLVSALVAVTANAQGRTQYAGEGDHSTTSLWVTATAGKDHIRFASLGIGQRMRLEIVNQAGDRVFDSGFRDGNLVDWQMDDNVGNRLPDDAYGCLIAVEDMNGQSSHRRALLRIANGMARFETLQIVNAETAASSEGEDTVIILQDDEDLPMIQLLHDGESGRIVSGRGGLSFRVGNALARKDVEYMRLTADGNVGIGVVEPQAKLDVDGLIRASEGIQFSDGTILNMEDGLPVLVSDRSLSAAVGGIGSQGKAGSTGTGSKTNRFLVTGGGITPVLAAAGTPDQIAKFINATDLGDSAITESAGNVGIGITAPGAKLDVIGLYGLPGSSIPAGWANRVSGRRGVVNGNRGFYEDVLVGPYGYYAELSTYKWDDNTTLPLVFNANGGNVGIGSIAPGAILDVIGSYGLPGNSIPTGWANRVTGRRGVVKGNRGFYEDIIEGPYGYYAELSTYKWDDGTALPLVFNANGGNVGIGTTDPQAKLTVEGNVEVKGTGNGILLSDGSVLTSNAAARVRAITYLAGCDSCSALTDADDQRTIFVNLIGAMTIDSVTCFSDAGLPTVAVRRDNGTAANILTSSLTCSTTGSTSTAIVPAQSTLNLNDQIHFEMVSADGVAKRVTVIIKATVN